MDRGRERQIINETGKVGRQRGSRGRWTWGKGDERGEKERGEGHMLGRDVKEG